MSEDAGGMMSGEKVMQQIDKLFAGVQSSFLASSGPPLAEALAPVRQILVNSIMELGRLHKYAEEHGIKLPPPNTTPPQASESRRADDPAPNSAKKSRKHRRAAAGAPQRRSVPGGGDTSHQKEGSND